MRLPTPAPGADAAVGWVRDHLAARGLTLEPPDAVSASPAIRGGQTAAEAVFAALDLDGYARRRSQVWPAEHRGASRVSPYVRYGLLQLPALWRAAAAAPPQDRDKYRDELLWQEYARHVYARLGGANRDPLRHPQPLAPDARGDATARGGPWDRRMACMDAVVDELERDGWLVNQTRMWLASQWAVRAGRPWQAGEDALFAHLLDGSRAANRLGWQWTVGTATGRPYGFSRWQVEKRAPGLCARCPLNRACPVQDWPEPPDAGVREERPPVGHRLRRDDDVDATAGPKNPEVTGTPEAVWLTFESMGDADPALTAHPELPVVTVFDAPLLGRLRLSGKRLVFLVETLADLATRRDVEVHVGDPVEVLAGRPLATTFAPVPGWRRRAPRLDVVAVHPWPWLVRPHAGSLSSFTSWRRAVKH